MDRRRSTADRADFGAACLKNTGALLQHVDTVSAARDLDLLRAVLGDKKLNYLGYSYGTYLGAIYADLFPRKTGRLVLDGALDPAATNFDVTEVQAKGFESALRAYLDDCLSQKDCPFTGTVDERDGARSRQLLAAVEAEPDPQLATAASSARTPCSPRSSYPLYDATAGRTSTSCSRRCMQGERDRRVHARRQLQQPQRRTAPTPTTRPRRSSRSTASTTPTTPTPPRCATQAAELAKAAPVIGPYMAYGDIGCANWPYTATGERGPIAADGSGAHPRRRHDQRPGHAVRLGEEPGGASSQNGHLLTYKGEGHTAYNKSNSCVNDTVDDYLVKGTLPDEGKTC